MVNTSKDYTLVLKARDDATRVLKALGATGFKEARRLANELDRTEKELKDVERQGKRTERSLGTGFKKITGFLRQSFIPALIAGVAAFAGFNAAARGLETVTRNASEFQTALGEIRTILPETEKGVLDLREETLKLAVATGEVETVIARGLYQTISAGVTDAADALTVLESATRLAVGGVSNTASTVDVLTSVLNAYQFEASESERISDILFTTVRQGKTTVDQLAASIAAALPQANVLGVEFEEVAAAVATLTKQGFTSSEAVTNLASLFRALSKRTAEVDKALRSVGSRFDDQTFKTRSLQEVLDELASVIDGSTTRSFDTLGARAEATNALFGLTGKNARTFAADLDAIANSGGNAAAAFEEIAGTPAFRAQQALQAVRSGFIALGDEILAATGEAIDALGGVETIARSTENLGRRIAPIITELIRATGEVLEGFTVQSEDIEIAAARTELWVNQVRSLAEEVRGVVQWWREFFTIGDEAGREFRTFAASFGDNITNGAGPFADELVSRFAGAIDNDDRLALAVQRQVRRIEQIGEELEFGGNSLFPEEVRALVGERLKLIEEVADAARRLGTADLEAAESRLGSLAEERAAIEEKIELLERAAGLAAIEAAEAERASQARALEGRQRDRRAAFERLGRNLTDPRSNAIFQATGISLTTDEVDTLIEKTEELALTVENRLTQAWVRFRAQAAAPAQTEEQARQAEEVLLSLAAQTARTEEEKIDIRLRQVAALEASVREQVVGLDLTERQSRELERQLGLLRSLASARPVEDVAGDLQARLRAVGEDQIGRGGIQQEQLRAQFDARNAEIDQLRKQGEITDATAASLRQLNVERTNSVVAQENERRAAQRIESAYQSFTRNGVNALENSLVAVITQSQTAKEAFGELARAIVADLIRLALRLTVTNLLLTIFDSLTTFGAGTQTALKNVGDVSAAQSIAFQPAPIAPLATGGLVTEPTLALVGEAGPEMVVPVGPSNARNAPGITPLRTALSASPSLGGGAGNVTYQPVIVVQAIDPQSGLAFLERNGDAIASGLAVRIGRQADITDAIRGQGGGVPGTF